MKWKETRNWRKKVAKKNKWEMVFQNRPVSLINASNERNSFCIFEKQKGQMSPMSSDALQKKNTVAKKCLLLLILLMIILQMWGKGKLGTMGTSSPTHSIGGTKLPGCSAPDGDTHPGLCTAPLGLCERPAEGSAAETLGQRKGTNLTSPAQCYLKYFLQTFTYSQRIFRETKVT